MCKATGRSIDEVSLLFHRVLKEINYLAQDIQISQTSKLHMQIVLLCFFQNYN